MKKSTFATPEPKRRPIISSKSITKFGPQNKPIMVRSTSQVGYSPYSDALTKYILKNGKQNEIDFSFAQSRHERSKTEGSRASKASEMAVSRSSRASEVMAVEDSKDIT